MKKTLSTSALAAYHQDCTLGNLLATPEYSKACVAAAHRFCQTLGFEAGILQEINPYVVVTLCTQAVAEVAPVVELQWFHRNCTAAGLASTTGYNLACTSAAHRVCNQRGYAGGVLQELAAGVAKVSCFKSGKAVPVEISQLSAEHPSCTHQDIASHAGYTKACLAAAHRLCSRRGYAGGQPVEVSLPSLIVACSY